MIWSLFKNCRKNKNEYLVDADLSETVFHRKRVLKDILTRLDALTPDGYDDGNDDDDVDGGGGVYITDGHFDSLSVSEIHNFRRVGTVVTTSLTVHGGPENDYEDQEEETEATTAVAVKYPAKVSGRLLQTLQCPLTWTDIDDLVWDKNVVSRVRNKYGDNSNITDVVSPTGFSFEKYVSSLVVCCGLFKTNDLGQAHDKLTDIWKSLDKLDEAHEPFYLTVRDGLKHIVMSTLCYVLYATNRTQCQQLYKMTTQFNTMDSKSRAAVYGIRSAVCIALGGDALHKAVQYAKKACDLDADTAYWNYYHSMAMTAHRQYFNTCKSSPTEAEFDAIQYAIILTTKPNPYFNFHRMNLMKNKILYHYYVNSRNSSNDYDVYDENNCIYVNKNSSKKIKQDFKNVVELIKAIIVMEPDDPHLVVKCAISLMTLPFVNRDIVHLIKQIISIALNIALNDPSIVQVIKKSIEFYEELYITYKELEHKNEKVKLLESVKTQKPIKDNSQIENEKQKDVILENDFRSIVKKHKKQGSVPLIDLIDLLDKFNGYSKWKILAQICSYSIIFVDSTNLLNGVEQFMMLIQDREIANSDIVTNHRSIFITDPTKVFNLAELVCNEIKLAITFGHTKNQDETQFYLNTLTDIIEVCQLRSKKINTTFISDLTSAECTNKEPKTVRPRNATAVVNQQQCSEDTTSKPTTSLNKNNKPRRLKQNSNKNHNRTIKYKPKTKKKSTTYV